MKLTFEHFIPLLIFLGVIMLIAFFQSLVRSRNPFKALLAALMTLVLTPIWLTVFIEKYDQLEEAEKLLHDAMRLLKMLKEERDKEEAMCNAISKDEQLSKTE